MIRALSDLHEVKPIESDITKEKYDELGLGMSSGARLLREKVGIKLELDMEIVNNFINA